MNDLEQYFNQNENRLIAKWNHYFDIYDRHFSRYRDKNVVILEIGVFQGGSLQMWKNYFGKNATIYAIDINPACKELEEEGIHIFIGSQSDRQFLRKVKEQIPKIDILIDDGGHTMRQQIVTFEELFDHVSDDGVFLCEDLHTSYWIEYGGGHKRRGTFIEYSKNFIDLIHAYHSTQRSLQVNDFTTSVDSLHYYDSILVIEKQKRKKPVSKQMGFASIPMTNKINNSILKKVRYRMDIKFNKILRFFRIREF